MTISVGDLLCYRTEGRLGDWDCRTYQFVQVVKVNKKTASVQPVPARAIAGCANFTHMVMASIEVAPDLQQQKTSTAPPRGKPLQLSLASSTLLLEDGKTRTAPLVPYHDGQREALYNEFWRDTGLMYLECHYQIRIEK